MQFEELTHDSDQTASRFEYDDETVLAVDFGSAVDGSIDIVDETVIVVLEDDQYELELPAPSAGAEAFMKNGVLTIELEENL
ncbi:MAG: Hsp20/alpha crystallin family protein [Natrialbaceae archaeon]|nr:Hsp20/alpha crystallin family protein [Natrialbaceae archaeon]